MEENGHLTVMELLPCPLRIVVPDGTDHKYVLAPGMLATLYVMICPEGLQSEAGPVIAPNDAEEPMVISIVEIAASQFGKASVVSVNVTVPLEMSFAPGV